MPEAGKLHPDHEGVLRRDAAQDLTGGRRHEHAIAVDLGGTKVIAVVADSGGAILAERTEPTRTDSAEALLGQLRALAADLVRDAGLAWTTVGVLAIGVPGSVDPVSGEIRLAVNLPDLTGVSLAAQLATLGEGLRVVVENDVNAAALGERWQGLATGADPFAFVAIGTGIGAGVVVNGELCVGQRGAAGEIGWLPLGEDPFDPGTRHRGALEEAVSGRAIVAGVERRLAAGATSELAAGCSAADVFAAAARGDALACEAVDREARLVAMAVAALAVVVAPELVVLGGSIGANELLLEPVRRYAAELTAQPPRIERSALGSRAALVGALALALQSTCPEVLDRVP
ncbi:MAG TPA: ROK family protein [Conexibacter sp.]|nr:ROK family protein [Conexibacter sp.]